MASRFLLLNRVIALALSLVLLGMSQLAYAPSPLPRIALVIGNSHHQDAKLGNLRTARNDAEDIAKSLTNQGYQVSTQFDGELSALRDGITNFSGKLKSDAFRDGVALIYFAGYGLQKNGRNFLLPTNFDASNEHQDMDSAAIAVDLDIIKKIGGRSGGANVIILDACREDPFGQRQGLAQMDDVPNGTLVELAAEPNNQSIENPDPKAPERNGLYAKQLLKKLDTPNPDLDIRHFFDVVGNNVYEASNQQQKPRIMTAQTFPAMPERVSLFQESTPTLASPDELKFWKLVDHSAEACAFEQYLKRFPNGAFADSARATMTAINMKIESAPKAFAELPAALKEQVRQSFDKKRAQEKADCERKWAGYGSGSFRLAGRSAGALDDGVAEVFRNPSDRSGYLKAAYAGERSASPASLNTRSARNTVLAEFGDEPQEGASDIAQTEANPQAGDEEFRADLLEARQGEINSMYRVALVYEEGGHGVEADFVEMMHWQALSSSLGNGLASYKLYRYFAGEPTGYVKAVKFRSLAGRQGYYGPVKLSDRR